MRPRTVRLRVSEDGAGAHGRARARPQRSGGGSGRARARARFLGGRARLLEDGHEDGNPDWLLRLSGIQNPLLAPHFFENNEGNLLYFPFGNGKPPSQSEPKGRGRAGPAFAASSREQLVTGTRGKRTRGARASGVLAGAQQTKERTPGAPASCVLAVGTAAFPENHSSHFETETRQGPHPEPRITRTGSSQIK